MRLSKRVLWIAVVALFIVAAFLFRRHVEAQRFALLVDRLHSQDDAERAAAIQELVSKRGMLVRLIEVLDNPRKRPLAETALVNSGERGAALLVERLESDEFLATLQAMPSKADAVSAGDLPQDAPEGFQNACKCLLAMGTPAVPALAGMLSSSSEWERSIAARLLGIMADPSALQPLIDAAGDPSPLVRWPAAWALGEMRSARAWAALTPCLDDPDPLVAEAALEAVASLGRDLPVHKARTSAVHPVERRWKALPLGTLRGTDTVEALVRKVLSGTNSERDLAADLLCGIGDPAAADALMDGMGHPTAQVRAAVIKILAAMGERRALDGVIDALGDSEVEVRKVAAAYLREIRSPRALDPLISVLRSDPVENARSYAAWALDLYEDDRALEALLAATSDRSALVRRSVIYALGRRSDDASTGAVVRAVRDRYYEVRVMALGRLNEFPKPAGVEAAIGALGDPYDKVRECAIRFLGTAKDPRALEPLLVLLAGDDKDAALQAALALGELADPRAVEGLIAATKRHYDIADCAMLALGTIGDPRAVAPLSDLLIPRSYPHVASYAACALAMIGTDEALAELHRVLPNVDFAEVARNYPLYILTGESEYRRMLAAALFLHGDERMAQDLYWCGQHEFERIARHWTERHALTHPRKAGDNPERPKWGARPGAVFDLMVARLKYRDPEVRAAAAEKLSLEIRSAVQSGSGPEGGSNVEALEPAFAALAAALADDDPMVRGCAAESLGKTQEPEYIGNIAQLLDDPNIEVRLRAIRGIGELKHPDAAPVLIETMRDASPEMRAEAAWFAGYSPAEEVLEPLVGLLDDESPEVRINAAIGLGFMADEGAVAGLKRALEDEDVRVITAAAWALGRVATPESRAALDEAAGRKIDAVRRDYLHLIRRGDEKDLVPLMLMMARINSNDIATTLYYSGHPDLKAAAETWKRTADLANALVAQPWLDLPKWGSDADE